jgi:hypothetical protein
MSTLKVGGIRGVSASSDAITVANDGTCTAKVTNNLSNRNIIINGAMQVAQRSGSSTVAVTEGTNEGYQSIDRIHFSFGNAAAGACNLSQSTDAPTTLGFTKSHKTDVTTVNTTSSGNGVISLQYQIEGQDLRSSGWNHLSDSSFLTLSFYFKTTKTGNSKLPIMFRTRHGTNYYYVKNITVTDPTNWNRYTCKIPGNSNLTINDLATAGMSIFFSYQTGSDKDTSSEGAWGTTNAYSTSESTNYFDSTSNDMFITGIQLEVGEHATDFEHRTYAQELELCKRYFFVIGKDSKRNNNRMSFPFINEAPSNTGGYIDFRFHPEMRATPTATIGAELVLGRPQIDMGNHHVSSFNDMGPNGCHFFQYTNQTGSTADADKYMRCGHHDDAFAEFSAEL